MFYLSSEKWYIKHSRLHAYICIKRSIWRKFWLIKYSSWHKIKQRGFVILLKQFADISAERLGRRQRLGNDGPSRSTAQIQEGVVPLPTCSLRRNTNTCYLLVFLSCADVRGWQNQTLQLQVFLWLAPPSVPSAMTQCWRKYGGMRCLNSKAGVFF